MLLTQHPSYHSLAPQMVATAPSSPCILESLRDCEKLVSNLLTDLCGGRELLHSVSSADQCHHRPRLHTAALPLPEN